VCNCVALKISVYFIEAAGVGFLSELPDCIYFFQTKTLSLDKFWRVLQWKMLVYFIDL
jgi:hypothetical protein